MTKELQDLAWAVLPKEFKEEVKFEYHRAATKASKEEYDLGFMHAHEGMFGIHNLTSDAEGEEMLAISRREIQQLVAANDKLIKKHPGRDSIEAIQAKTVNTILNRLFGSKCLPDNVDNLEQKPEAENNIDLVKLNKQLDAVLNSETKESLEEWMKTMTAIPDCK